MVQKSIKLLLFTALVAPLQVNASRKCKTLCSLIVQNCLRVKGNEIVNGNLTVDGNTSTGSLTVAGVNYNTLITLATSIGAGTGAPTTGLGTLVSSIIPFSSGLGAATAAPITLTAGLAITAGYVIGFGDNALVTPGTLTSLLQSTYGSFAFSVPEAGTLHNLQVSIDAEYILASGATAYPFTFTILHSSAANGAANAYTATSLVATATLPGTGAAAGSFSAYGSNAGSISVAAGDRIVLLIQPTVTIPTVTITSTGFNAGVLFSPA